MLQRQHFLFRRFLSDDRGASDIVATLLKVAFIVVPLAMLLIIFRDEIAEWSQSVWGEMMGSGKKSY